MTYGGFYQCHRCRGGPCYHIGPCSLCSMHGGTIYYNPAPSVPVWVPDVDAPQRSADFIQNVITLSDVGTSKQVADAHAVLDVLGVAAGKLAIRVMAACGALAELRERLPRRKKIRDFIYAEVDAARDHQDAKFGWLGDPKWGLASDNKDRKLRILVEEVGEVARAINDGDDANLRHELYQVAACAVAWVEGDMERAAAEQADATA